MSRFKVSFKITILVLFVILTSGLSSAVIYVNYTRNTDAALAAADDLLAQVGRELQTQTHQLIQPLFSLAELIVLLPAGNMGAESSDTTRPLAAVMRAAMDQYTQIASIYFGNEAGEFFRIASLEGDRSAARDVLKAPRETMFAVQSIMATTEGARVTAWRFFNADNLEIAARNEPKTVYDPRTRPWFQAARASRYSIVTDYYLFAAVPTVGLTVARAFGDEKGTILGADLTVSSASKFLSDVRSQQLAGKTRAEVAIFQTDGRLIAYSDRDAYERFLNAAATPRMPMVGEVGGNVLVEVAARARAGTTANMRLEDKDGVRWLAFVSPMPPAFGDDARLVVTVPLEEFLGPLAQSARETLLISILVVLAFLPVVYWISNAVSRPLARLTAEIEQLRHFDAAGSEHVRSVIAEIQDLGNALATSKFMIGAFGKYVPKSLVQQMMDSGIQPAIAGERRPVTVFFSDVRDFTTMSEELPPERLMQLTSEYLEGLVDIILANRGTVDKFVGDQIMAYWNAPLSNPDHFGDGCLAVLRCRDWSNRRNAEWEAAGEPILYTRFALHAGDAVVGNVGSSDRMDYTVVGNTINLGSRLEGLNKIYGTQVLISDPVAAAVKERFVMRPIDKVLPKGAVFPLGLFELRGAHPDWKDAPPELVVERRDVEMCARWSEVYAHYLARDWSALLRALEAFTAEFGEDSVATLYFDRVTRFIMEPPEDDWDGVIRYTEK